MFTGKAKTEYMRAYMRKRRAAARSGKGLTRSNKGTDKREADALRALLAEREREIAQLRAALGQAQPPNQAKTKATVPPKPEPNDRAAVSERMHADFEAYDRERAQWGGRPKRLVIDDIKRLLRGRFYRPDDVTQIIVEAIAPHVRDQANITDGIPRQVFRKVLAGLHTDRNPATAEAFIAFKKLDVRDGGKPNPRSIVIADDKVRTMSDYWRKREARNAAARAKRKAK